MHLFKVWTKGGEEKAFVTITANENICKNLISQASKKLQINGNSLVLDSDETPVTEDEVLLLIKTETLILLEENEIFTKIPDLGIIAKTTENSSILDISEIPFIESDLNTNMNYERKENIPDNLNQQQSAIIEVIHVKQEELNCIDYKVPWNKVPTDMLKICEEGIKNKNIITEICHIIVNDIRQINKNVLTTTLKKIAFEMIQKYPETFMDKDEDGHILGDGSCSMFHKLRERCCYMKRIESKQKSTEKSKPIQSKQRKFHIMAGCSNYQDLHSTNAKHIRAEHYDEDSFEKMMKDGYIQQRKFLENFQEPPSLTDIQKEFPILFKLESIIFHFNKLTGKKLEKLPNIMKEKSTKIVEYAIQNKYLKLDNNEDYCIQSLRFFALYFKDFEKMYYKIENENTNLNEILQMNAPCIVSIGNHFQVFVEKQLFGKEFSTFIEARQCAFGIYYVMCLQYPAELSNTLEMVQRYYLKINPDRGSKASKNKNKTALKVIKLIMKLNK
ncbi:uncharacterized protein LOC105206844 isoform X1 [Solenopsis invicta]|uniref:uncharacterized protein LOC105206844 isoform X1 n=1 Tax=Solenopsis invicta TaxID=13686 RepID=UPI00193D190B|nr:uncharacterized protein LOC105206844 isoform X1 [Solenopsis invicta]XP_039302914.1 uncharacterized protein LOC105206844 isoform X1 [Solenopsis invicta]XP_039302915.1 uncharacterized protein LOC105206844 isoform X1 [Solenopsis invicta]